MIWIFLVTLYFLIGQLFIQIIDDDSGWKDEILISIFWPILVLLYLTVVIIYVVKIKILKK